MDRAGCLFFTLPAVFNSSTTTVGFSPMMGVEKPCRAQELWQGKLYPTRSNGEGCQAPVNTNGLTIP